MKLSHSIILNTDSYKCSQFRQYPPGTEYVYSYIESRGGEWDRTVFFGLQAFLREYMTTPITQADIDIAEKIITAHGEPFNREGWEYIVKQHGGKLPVEIRALPEGTVWRHNQAGDLPGDSNTIDRAALRELVSANRGRRGFTYTHKPLTQKNISAIRSANQRGFTVNLSANNLAHADELVAKDVGPVTVVLPAEQTTNTVTPAGNKVVVCPATTHEDVTCKSCELCAISTRKVIVGFPAHGTRKRQASEIARG